MRPDVFFFAYSSEIHFHMDTVLNNITSVSTAVDVRHNLLQLIVKAYLHINRVRRAKLMRIM